MRKFPFGLLCCAVMFMGVGCSSSAVVTPAPSTPVPATAPVIQVSPSPSPSKVTTPVPPVPTSSPSAQVMVSISGFAFQSANLTVKAGATVTWTNKDPMAHTVTADDGSFDSGTMKTDATYSHTFTKAGTFSYYCSPHPFMKATVIVQ